jgi:general stress protein YciG
VTTHFLFQPNYYQLNYTQHPPQKMTDNTHPGNFANRPKEEVQNIASKGGQASHTGGFASMDPDKQVHIAISPFPLPFIFPIPFALCSLGEILVVAEKDLLLMEANDGGRVARHCVQGRTCELGVL